MTIRRFAAICAYGLLALAIAGAGAAAVGWRTDGTGNYPAAIPPTEWAPDKNILWTTPLPGWSNASPVLVGDRIFVCAEPSTLLCVSAPDGKVLWQRTNAYQDMVSAEEAAQIAEEQKAADQLARDLSAVEADWRKLKEEEKKAPDDAALKEKIAAVEETRAELRAKLAPYTQAWYRIPVTHPDNGYSSATPASDGRHVYAVFGTGIVACYDLEGNRQWIKFIEKPRNEWGHSASPVLVGGKLIVHYVNMFALNPQNGEILWKTAARESWGTPFPTRVGEVDVVITAGGDIIRVADGKGLAKGLSSLEYCAPVVENGAVYFIQNGGKAFKLPEQAADALAPQMLWQTKPKAERYYASPVIRDGLIYAIMQQSVFSVIDAATGEVVLERKLELGGGTVFPSICLAGGLLFVSSDTGVTLIMQPGREPKDVAVNRSERFRTTPVFAGDRIYIRGVKNMYCVGEPG